MRQAPRQLPLQLGGSSAGAGLVMDLPDTERSPQPSIAGFSDTRESRRRSPSGQQRERGGSAASSSAAGGSRGAVPRRAGERLHKPYASGGGLDVEGSSRFLDKESSGRVRSTEEFATMGGHNPCVRCCELEGMLESLRASREEDQAGGLSAVAAAELQQSELQERLLLCEDAGRLAAEERSVAEEELASAEEERFSGESRLLQAEAALARAREELQEQTALAGGAAAWQEEALQARVALTENEQERDDIAKKLQKARQQAGEAERQRRDLAKQSGTQETERTKKQLAELTEELEAATKKAKRVGPLSKGLQQAKEEEARLRADIVEERAVSAEHEERAEAEAAEVERVKEVGRQNRRADRKKMNELGTELAEALRLRQQAHTELGEEKRFRVEQDRRVHNLVGQRKGAFAEVEKLRGELEWAEEARNRALAQLRAQQDEVRGTGGSSLSQRHRTYSVGEATPTASTPTASRGVVSGQRRERDLGTPVLGHSRSAGAPAMGIMNQEPEGDGSPRSTRGVAKASPGHNARISSPRRSPGKPVALSNASVKLLDVIERARERQSQRADLDRATEAIRARARALEELIGAEDAAAL